MITDRIRTIMESENMTPARFADHLEIGRAVVSHILNGRNNPSLDVITRILSKMPQISPEWLLTGESSMYKNAISQQENVTTQKQIQSLPDLFSQLKEDRSDSVSSDVSAQELQKNRVENPINQPNSTEAKEYRNHEIVESPKISTQEIINERIIYKETLPKKIKQIIIYYSDNTFETFVSN